MTIKRLLRLATIHVVIALLSLITGYKMGFWGSLTIQIFIKLELLL